nr:uncharacterized protein LOC128694121 [Cherax quadricarinatus]
MSLDKRLTEVFTFFQDKDKNVVSVKDIPTIIRTLASWGQHDSCLASWCKLTLVSQLVYNMTLVSQLVYNMTLVSQLVYNMTLVSQLVYNMTLFRPAGSLSREDLLRLLTCEGEALTQDEAEELILSLPMKDSDLVDLDQYAAQLVPPAPFL